MRSSHRSDCSVVAAPYHLDDDVVGVLGAVVLVTLYLGIVIALNKDETGIFKPGQCTFIFPAPRSFFKRRKDEFFVLP